MLRYKNIAPLVFHLQKTQNKRTTLQHHHQIHKLSITKSSSKSKCTATLTAPQANTRQCTIQHWLAYLQPLATNYIDKTTSTISNSGGNELSIRGNFDSQIWTRLQKAQMKALKPTTSGNKSDEANSNLTKRTQTSTPA